MTRSHGGPAEPPGGAAGSPAPGGGKATDGLTTAAREVGAFLRSVRRALGLSQEQVAAHGASRRWRLSRSAISAIERGRNLPSVDALIALTRALGLDPMDVIRRVERVVEFPSRLDRLSYEDLDGMWSERSEAGDHRAIVEICDAMQERLKQRPHRDPAEHTRQRAVIELRRATALGRCGALSAARDATEQALSLARELPDVQAEAYVLASWIYARMGHAALSCDMADRAIERAPRADRDVIARAFAERGYALHRLEEFADARRALLEAKRRLIGRDIRAERIEVEGRLGLCQVALGRLGPGRAALKRAVALARRFALAREEAQWLVELARLDAAAGEDDSVERIAGAALRIATSQDHPLTRFRAGWLHYRATLRTNGGADPGALDELRKLSRRIGDGPLPPELLEFRRLHPDR